MDYDRYLAAQVAYRDTTVYSLKATAAQADALVKYLEGIQNGNAGNYGFTAFNCAQECAWALLASGIRVDGGILWDPRWLGQSLRNAGLPYAAYSYQGPGYWTQFFLERIR